jgi:hypothetical protein
LLTDDVTDVLGACRYNGSGKTFYIGQWEGDWSIRDELNKDANANPKKVQQMIKLLSDKQRGVDDAKRATGHKDVSSLAHSDSAGH